MSASVEKMEIDTKLAMEIKKETEEELHLNVLSSQNVIINEDFQSEDQKVENKENEDGNKMDIDERNIPVSDSGAEEKKKEDPVLVTIIPTHQGRMQLSVNGIDDSDDDETMILTPEEVRSYLEQKIREYLTDPEINPFLELTKRSQELQEELKEKNAEFNKLNKLLELIYRNQEKFLRHMGILPKIPTSSIAISVDLPILPNTVPRITNNNQESLLRRDLITQNTVNATSAQRSILLPVNQNPAVTKEPSKPDESGQRLIHSPSPSSIECIDLTDETDTPSATSGAFAKLKHPAPLPPKPFSVPNKLLSSVPPKPRLKVHAEDRGIVLQWDMPHSIPPHSSYSKLIAFEIYGYQEQADSVINTLLWKKIGSVKAMILPMACTLTQFLEGNKYHFAIRAVDVHNRCGSYSDPISVVYNTRLKKT